MKNILSQIVACFLFSYTLSATPVITKPQDTIRETKIIELDWGSDDDDEDDASFSLRVGTLDLGFSSYLDDGSLDLGDDLSALDQVLWRSINVGLYLANVRTSLLGKNKPAKLTFNTGVKINWAHYSMQQDYNLLRNQPDFNSAKDFNVPELKKNRLRATYLQIPLILEFSSKPSNSKQSFNLGVGYVHQFLLGSQYKYKTTEGDKLKTRGDFNLRKSMGMVEARLGVGHLNFYVQYGLDHLFQDNNGPELTPINFGINLIPR